MLKYFKYSIIVTIAGLICAYLWGEHVLIGSGLKCLLIALFLAILEITLSFDNAIINAIRLEKMNHVWQQRFLTWGIFIAVFGVRLFLPILIVAVFSHHQMGNVFDMALHDVAHYSQYLHQAHTPLVTFGGIFLLLIFLDYFFNCKKDALWIYPVEKCMAHVGQVNSMEIIISLIVLFILQSHVEPVFRHSVLIAGLGAILVFLIINGVCNLLESLTQNEGAFNVIGKIGFVNFLYLELIDTSFSLDGLLGAFAISKDIIIIMLGLAIGAMFVRSLTIFMVEKRALDRFIYLSHGAHYAIGFLALVMLISTKIEVAEWVTGTVSLLIIISAFISSIYEKRKGAKNVNQTLE